MLILQSTMAGQHQFNIAKWRAAKAKGYTFKDANRVRLDDRTGKEWDIRIDITDRWNIVSILDRLQCNKDAFAYLLVGGLEFGTAKLDRPVDNKWNSENPEPHIHIAMITKNIVSRLDALKFVREFKTGGEYCVPRKTNLTYIGWRLHHSKPATKSVGDKILLEHGQLPMDAITPEISLQVYYMVRRYGREEDKNKFKIYYDGGLELLRTRGAEKKRRAEEEVETLRARLEKAEKGIDVFTQTEL